MGEGRQTGGEVGRLFPKTKGQVFCRRKPHEGFTVFAFPAAHKRRLRTSNALERVNEELKRRTRVVSIFPNEASLLRLVSALLTETSDDWESSKSYLNMNPSISPSA